jgi:hypothetical protein
MFILWLYFIYNFIAVSMLIVSLNLLYNGVEDFVTSLFPTFLLLVSIGLFIGEFTNWKVR